MKDIYSKVNNICLLVLAGTAITFALYYTRVIMIPFAIALFIYAMISPSAKWLQKKINIPRLVSVLLVIIFFILVLIVLLSFITVSVERFISSIGIYRENIVKFVSWCNEQLIKWDINIDEKVIESHLRDLPFITMAKNVTGSVIKFISNIVLIMVFILFLITGRKKRTKPVISEISLKITKYIRTKLFISLITGIITGVVLFLFNVELAFMFGILAIFLNFIPNLGSLIAVLLPLPVVLLQFGPDVNFFLILILTTCIQFLMGNIIEPKLHGENLDLHPITILLFLIFWGIVWGLPGMFLAVPITVILRIVFSRLEATKPIADILAGRFPK